MRFGISLFKGLGNEVVETVVDRNGLTILAQELREAGHGLRSAMGGLSRVMAHHAAESRKLENVERELGGVEAKARQALDLEEEDLALRLAERIGDLEAYRDRLATLVAGYAANLAWMKTTVREMEQRIATMRQDLNMAKAQGELIAAQRQDAPVRNMDASVASAEVTLRRIQASQQFELDRLRAAQGLAQDFDGDDLDNAMLRAGLIDDRQGAALKVLDRIRSLPGETPATGQTET